jgi:3-hydroxyisobutyrate dehydrogenase-like beta-hydroxyacid dehydrogenase
MACKASFLKDGYTVHAFDIDPTKIEAVKAFGAIRRKYSSRLAK